LLTAALVGGGTVYSSDTEATVECVRNLSTRIESSEREITIEQDRRPPEIRSTELNANESGTLLRFLIPICSVLGGPSEVILDGRKTLRERTHTEVLETMRSNGFKIDIDHPEDTVPIRCYPGQSIPSEPIRLTARTTSQHVSGWLIALAAGGGGTVVLEGEVVSRPYISMTAEVLRSAGVTVEEDDRRIRVNPRSVGEFNYRVPGDFSSAAFFLVGGVLTQGSLDVGGLRKDDPQADRRIIEILSDLGAEFHWKSDESMRILPPHGIDGFTLDASDCPDLVPILTVLGSFADDHVRIENIEHLANKESDRLKAPCRELQKLGVDAQPYSDRIEIQPDPGRYRGGTVESHDDHRIAMALSIFGAVNGNVTVRGTECVDKSYPEFYGDLKGLDVTFESDSR